MIKKITLKDTNIMMTCNSADEMHALYCALGNKFTFVIDGVELKKIGPTESKNPNVSAYFSGYTKGYFEKFFK